MKSGKDYTVHSALDNFLNTPDYHIIRAIVFSNEQQASEKDGIMYLPIYYCMFLERSQVEDDSGLIIPSIPLPPPTL